jgi:hypothetical protein
MHVTFGQYVHTIDFQKIHNAQIMIIILIIIEVPNNVRYGTRFPTSHQPATLKTPNAFIQLGMTQGVEASHEYTKRTYTIWAQLKCMSFLVSA